MGQIKVNLYGIVTCKLQEAQLMLTNPRDVSRGQSRSPNIVPFHMLGILSSCAIVTVTFLIFDVKKCRDLEIRVRGHSRSLKVVTLSLRRAVFSDIRLQKMLLESGSEVT